MSSMFEDTTDRDKRQLSEVREIDKMGTKYIDNAKRRVAEYWPFNRDNYPQLQSTRPAAIRHVILHFNKDVGRMATAIEPADHGKMVDYTLLRRSTRNALVNALRLCDLLEVEPSQLLADYYAEMTPIPGEQ